MWLVKTKTEKTATETQVIVSTIVTLSLVSSTATVLAASAGAIGILKHIFNIFFSMQGIFYIVFFCHNFEKGRALEAGGRGPQEA